MSEAELAKLTEGIIGGLVASLDSFDAMENVLSGLTQHGATFKPDVVFTVIGISVLPTNGGKSVPSAMLSVNIVDEEGNGYNHRIIVPFGLLTLVSKEQVTHDQS